MCGIVGVAGNITPKMDKVFKNLLIMDSVRGIDSTGIASVSKGGDVIVSKQVGNPFELMEYSSFNKAINRQNKVIIGHNRWATVGGITRASAHPFDFDSLVGVHNGTLTNKWKLDDSVDFKVDSQNLFHHIDKHNLEKAIGLIEGAWSLVWWDKYNNSLNFLRNKERPMYIARTEDRSLVWASEDWMIEAACGRNEIKVGEIFFTSSDKHYEYPINLKGEVDEPIKNMVHGAVAVPFVNNGAWRNSGATNEPKPNNVSVTPTGRVVTFPTATTSSVQQQQRSSDVSYAGKKNVVLEVIGEGKDAHGARYAICVDDLFPYTEVRLYLKKNDKNLVGKVITANIGQKVNVPDARGFYKVEYNTFRIVVPENTYHVGVEGTLLSSSAWEKKHGICCWCNGDVPAVSKHRFTVSGESVCESCLADPEIINNTSFT